MENNNYIASISLNSSNVHNITIIGTNLRYTRCIDRKFHTFESNYDSYEELVCGLQVTSCLTNEIFILTCDLNNKVRQNANDSLDV